MTQTSQVFNQRAWPGAGDVDDCWVVSSLQAANTACPWLPLFGVGKFRGEAGDPDDGVNDGGNLSEIVAGLKGCYPTLAPYLKVLKQAPWATFVKLLDEDRPITVAVKSSDLPQRLQYGFRGFHQVTVCRRQGAYALANPLAPVYSAWDKLASIDEIRLGVMNYGAEKAGQKSVWGVALPSPGEAAHLYPGFDAAVADAVQNASGQALQVARAQGWAEAKAQAIAAVSAI